MTTFLLQALLLTSPEAHADTKVLPGSACQATTSSYSSYFAISNGRARNTSSTTTISVDCPIVDDTSGSITDTVINVYDGSSTSAVECTVYSRYLSSSSSYASASAGSTGTGNYTLSIGAVGGSGGSYYQHIYCLLPGASYLYGYKVTES